jgi:8-oxo-dGTP diphosphatase
VSVVDFVRNQITAFFPHTPLGLRMIRLCMHCGYTGLRLYWFLFRPITVGVQCIVICDDKVLLIRTTYGHQLWTVPGGGIKQGETPEAAVRREVTEEVGITLNAVRSLGTFQGREDYRHDTVHVFTVHCDQPLCTTDPGEILEAQWFALDALPTLAPYAQQVFALWRRQSRRK